MNAGLQKYINDTIGLVRYSQPYYASSKVGAGSQIIFHEYLKQGPKLIYIFQMTISGDGSGGEPQIFDLTSNTVFGTFFNTAVFSDNDPFEYIIKCSMINIRSNSEGLRFSIGYQLVFNFHAKEGQK